MILHAIVAPAIVSYVYLVYPLILWGISRHKQLRVERFEYHELPSISVVVVVRNAAAYIEEKLCNTL
jgi:hypothetical protein